MMASVFFSVLKGNLNFKINVKHAILPVWNAVEVNQTDAQLVELVSTVTNFL